MKTVLTLLLITAFLLTACTGEALRVTEATDSLELDISKKGSSGTTSTTDDDSSSGGGSGVLLPGNETNETIPYYDTSVYGGLSRYQDLGWDRNDVELYIRGTTYSDERLELVQDFNCDYADLHEYLASVSALYNDPYNPRMYRGSLTGWFRGERFNGVPVSCNFAIYNYVAGFDFYENNRRVINPESYTLAYVNDARLVTDSITGEKLVHFDVSNERGGISTVVVDIQVDNYDGSELEYSQEFDYANFPISVVEFFPINYDLTNARFVSLRTTAYVENGIRTDAYRWYEVGTSSTLKLNKDGKSTTFETTLVDRPNTDKLFEAEKELIREEMFAKAEK